MFEFILKKAHFDSYLYTKGLVPSQFNVQKNNYDYGFNERELIWTYFKIHTYILHINVCL